MSVYKYMLSVRDCLLSGMITPVFLKVQVRITDSLLPFTVPSVGF